MRKKTILLCLIFLPFLLNAQEKSEEKISRISMDLDAGHEFKMNSMMVRFLEVVSDSRCPRQVTCIWPGEAKVKLGISIGGEYFEKEVVVGSGGADFALSEALQLQVSHLLPYPETGAGIAPEDYRIRFAATFSEED